MAARAYLPEVEEQGLEKFARELEEQGLTVLPPEVTGLHDAQIDEMVDLLLAKAQDLVGCRFALDTGPDAELTFSPSANQLNTQPAEQGQPSQFLIQRLSSHARVFRNLAINPTALALIRSMIGRRATRFSSHNSFIKWRGDFGYGSSLGMHVDQTAVPQPWGSRAFTANTNWCLTDYTLDGGALAYVPGSHKLATRPQFPDAVEKAVPVEAARGSVIIFHGATWHGAFPRKLPGMRISIANYFRHMMVTSQEDIKGHFDRVLADDCDDPALFKELAGFDDVFPYKAQTENIPTVAA